MPLRSILLVEGHAPTREYVAGILRAAGHQVREAQGCMAAWELFAASGADAALVSLSLPSEESQALVRRLREALPAPAIMVVDHAHLGQVTRRDLLERLEELGARGGSGASAGTATLLARPAALQGQLKGGMLPGTMLSLLRTFRDGVLVLQHGETVRRIYLRHGAPVNLDSTVRGESFDRWLLEKGQITEEQYRAGLNERAGGSLSPAAALAAVGAIEPGQPLYALLQEHLRALLAHCVSLKQGTFRFHAGDEFLQEVQVLDVPPLAHLLQGARAGFPFRYFLQALQAEQKSYPVLTGGFAEQLPSMGLNARDLKLALKISGRENTKELIAAHKSEMKVVCSLLWFMRLVEAVCFLPGPSRSEGASALRAAEEEKLRPLPPEEVASVREAALSILPGSYFKALGLDIACTEEDVERAYHPVAERFHPDLFAGFDLREVGDLLSQIQDKLSAAYRVLSVPEKRVAYLEHVLQRGPRAARGGRELAAEAEIAVKQAEKAMRGKRMREAVELLRKATRINPREPEYQAMLALALLNEPDVAADLRRTAARKAAKKALSLDRDNVRGLVALALVELEEGDAAEARKAVLAALRLSPKHALARWVLQKVNRVKP